MPCPDILLIAHAMSGYSSQHPRPVRILFSAPTPCPDILLIAHELSGYSPHRPRPVRIFFSASTTCPDILLIAHAMSGYSSQHPQPVRIFFSAPAPCPDIHLRILSLLQSVCPLLQGTGAYVRCNRSVAITERPRTTLVNTSRPQAEPGRSDNQTECHDAFVNRLTSSGTGACSSRNVHTRFGNSGTNSRWDSIC
jgi:hypothetical protein